MQHGVERVEQNQDEYYLIFSNFSFKKVANSQWKRHLCTLKELGCLASFPQNTLQNRENSQEKNSLTEGMEPFSKRHVKRFHENKGRKSISLQPRLGCVARDRSPPYPALYMPASRTSSACSSLALACFHSRALSLVRTPRFCSKK